MQVQILMLLASTYFTYRFIEVYVHYKNSTASGADGLNVYHLRHMRLTVLETRQGARSSVASVGLASMQGLLDGCKIPLRGALSGNATTLFCTYPEHVPMNGYVLETSQVVGSQPLDPSRFLLHVAAPRPDKSKTLADCLLSNEWSGPDAIAGKRQDELRKAVVAGLTARYGDWCDGGSCDLLSDEQLISACMPAHFVPVDEWKLVSASGCRWGLSVLQCLPKPLDRVDLSRVRGAENKFVSSLMHALVSDSTR